MSSLISALKCECGRNYKIVITEEAGENPTLAAKVRPSLTEVEVALREYQKLISVEQHGANGIVAVKPKDWLPKDIFGEICRRVERFGGKWNPRDLGWEI